jgi:hypothetical protein
MNEVANWHAYRLSSLLFLLATAPPAQLHAQAQCAAPFIHIDDAVPSTWDAALRSACERISTARDIDDAVAVHISFQDPELVLVAHRDDGRRTTRSVHASGELLTTLRALVMIPPGAAAESTQRTAAAAHRRLIAEREAIPAQPRNRRRNTPGNVAFGAVVMSRVAWSPTYLSPAFALHVGFRLSGWTFGFDARSEPYQFSFGQTPSGFEMDGFGAGVFLTRRVVDAESIAIDTGARAFLGVENQALEMNELANSASEVDARVGAVGRLLFGSGSPRWLVTLDAELSPMRLRREFKIYQYLPAVSVGVGIGVALESP